MKYCSYCNGDSPIDANYCINCGALFQANVGKTYRLDDKLIITYKEFLQLDINKLAREVFTDKFLYEGREITIIDDPFERVIQICKGES